MLTKVFLERAVLEQRSSLDIAKEIGGNARTVRWHQKKHGIIGLRTKQHPVWNKGLHGDPRVVKSARAAIAARVGIPSWNKGKKLGPLPEEQKRKQSISLRGKFVGPLSSGWKGGTTPILKRLRRTGAFKEWRTKVFQRDNYTCQDCGQRGGELHPHHIKAFAHFPDLRFELSNGQTLCKGCHLQTDSWGHRVHKRAA